MAEASDLTVNNVPENVWCCIDMNLYPPTEFKVLQCGHYFCINCLNQWAAHIHACPSCRSEDERSVDEMDDICNFTASPLVIEEPPTETNRPSFDELLRAQLHRRSMTVRYIKAAVEELAGIEFDCVAARFGGSALGVLGGMMVVTGSIMSLTGVGAAIGVPLVIKGAAVGGAGGLVAAGAVITDAIMKSTRLSGANEHLQKDFFHSIQLLILVGLASSCPKYASTIGLSVTDALSILSMVGHTAEFGATTAAAAVVTQSVAKTVAKNVGKSGLQIAGIFLTAALIPVDFAQMLNSSIELHKRDKSAVIKDFQELGHQLECELWNILKELAYTIVEADYVDSSKLHHYIIVASSQQEIDSTINLLCEKNELKYDGEGSYIVIVDSVTKRIDQSTYDQVFKFWSVEEIAENSMKLVQGKLKMMAGSAD